MVEIEWVSTYVSDSWEFITIFGIVAIITTIIAFYAQINEVRGWAIVFFITSAVFWFITFMNMLMLSTYEPNYATPLREAGYNVLEVEDKLVTYLEDGVEKTLMIDDSQDGKLVLYFK